MGGLSGGRVGRLTGHGGIQKGATMVSVEIRGRGFGALGVEWLLATITAKSETNPAMLRFKIGSRPQADDLGGLDLWCNRVLWWDGKWANRC